VILCEFLQQRRNNESVVGTCMGCTTGVVKVIAMDESWCDEFVYECVSEVRRVVRLYPSYKSSW
jgi:hypothetical protein